MGGIQAFLLLSTTPSPQLTHYFEEILKTGFYPSHIMQSFPLKKGYYIGQLVTFS